MDVKLALASMSRVPPVPYTRKPVWLLEAAFHDTSTVFLSSALIDAWDGAAGT